MSTSKIRLNKQLVQVGLAPSRRKADELISAGLVEVNGQIVSTLGSTVTETDSITVSGKQGSSRANIYLAYNKPRGEVCSHVSQSGEKTIFANLPKAFHALKIAGRLDKDSEGLVILSSDGEFINQVSHPTAQKQKHYIVTLTKTLDKPALQRLEEGIKLDGKIANAYKVRLLPANRVSLVLQEGRKRQIRRMFEALGYPIIRLERIQVGEYRNDSLMPGKYVFIKPEDVLWTRW